MEYFFRLGKKFWRQSLLYKFIFIPENCSLCTSAITLNENESTCNPIIGRCKNKKCRKLIWLRKFSPFNINTLTPCSVLYYILNKFICTGLNARKINEELNQAYGHQFEEHSLYDYLIHIRHYIAHYLYDKYKLEKLGVLNEFKTFAIDETLISHVNNTQLWIIGAIDTVNKDVRLILSFSRDEDTMKKFVETYIENGNTIITDAWRSYNFLDNEESEIHHIVHNHGHGDFGHGQNSTSHIEQYWSQLKANIHQMYNIVPKSNINLYIRESEFRISIRNLSYDDKLKKLSELFEYVISTNNNECYDDEKLNNL